MVTNTQQCCQCHQRINKHVSSSITRVHRVCGVEMNQRHVSGRWRSTAANWYQLHQIATEWVNVLRGRGYYCNQVILILQSI